MANLHKFTVQESLNTDTAGSWAVQTAVTTSDSTVTHIDVSAVNTVIFDCTSDIDVLFDTAATTSNSDTNDLKLQAGITSIKVPRGLGNTVYLHWRRSGSTDATVRIILA